MLRPSGPRGRQVSLRAAVHRSLSLAWVQRQPQAGGPPRAGTPPGAAQLRRAPVFGFDAEASRRCTSRQACVAKDRQRKHRSRAARARDDWPRYALAMWSRGLRNVRKLSVLVIHNQYQQPGGEDVVVRAEVDLVRGAGHRVLQFTPNNATLANCSPLEKAALFVTTTWNRTAYSTIRALIEKERPDIVHCHNLLPQVSPAAYYACQSAG